MLNIQEIKKSTEGLVFETEFNLTESLKKRNSDILDLRDVQVKGRVYFEDELFFLDYTLSYCITLASSRSMEPVDVNESYPVQEIFIESGHTSKQDWLDDGLILIIEGEEIDLSESVADNILLNIPMKVLTTEEEKGATLPSGTDWQVLTEEDYLASQKAKKEENNPFTSLAGFFEED